MDHVFTIRVLEQDDTDTAANEWRVRVRYVNRRGEYHVEGIEKAFDLVRSLLADSQGKRRD
jgi:hypothetical protein